VNSSSLAVRAGSVHLFSHDSESVQVSSVDQVIVHPSFNVETASSHVALVRLSRRLTLTETVRPVCLDQVTWSGSARYGVCVVAGWAPSRAPPPCAYIILASNGFIVITNFFITFLYFFS